MIMAALFMILQLSSELQIRYNSVFWEEGMDSQTVMAEYGPEKGLLITPEKLSHYDHLTKEAKLVCENPDIDRILYFENDSLFYLIAEKSIGSYSPWLSKISSHTVAQLQRYYEINPQKEPDIVYIPSGFADYASYFEEMGFSRINWENDNVVMTKNYK